MKVGRPNNYPTEPNAGLPPPVAERIYIANIHQDISEGDIAGVFEAFGKVGRIRREEGRGAASSAAHPRRADRPVLAHPRAGVAEAQDLRLHSV